MNAAITGFKNFGKNFLKHLQDALFEWLTGSLEGLKLPSTWDLKGIISVALQMIGISYDNLRKHMVTVMTEPVVKGLEDGFKLVQTLVVEGPIAAWEQLKEMAGEMRDAFIDAVKDFIKQKIIEEAIKWIVSLFIPGAGLIKAAWDFRHDVFSFRRRSNLRCQQLTRLHRELRRKHWRGGRGDGERLAAAFASVSSAQLRRMNASRQDPRPHSEDQRRWMTGCCR